MGNKRRFTLCARREIVKTMGLPENLKSNGFPNLYKLSKSVDAGGLGIDRKANSKTDRFSFSNKKLFPPNGNCKPTAYNSECNPK